MTQKKRILIVGGVAGGASCAARARRLSEEPEIVIFERGPYVSFANCGLPYYVGNVIRDEKKLLVATPELFRKRFNIEVRLRSEVLSIDRERQEIEVKDLERDETYRERYDALVLSPGANPIRPPIPGIDLPGIFTLRTIPDSRQIRDWITQYDAKRAVIVGGGFIGLEMAENLVKRGLAVTIVEMQPHVMPQLDPEMTPQIHNELTRKGVTLRLGQAVAGFEQGENGSLSVKLDSGATEEADLAILSIGIRPETRLAKEAGLALGDLGGIRVDDRMRTSDEHIWAVGDAVETSNAITGEWTIIPLAGPANRQGRIAADVIMGRDASFRGVQGTSVVGIFGLAVASTGLSEKSLKRSGLWDSLQCEKVYLHPGHHANYYPGSSMITFKLIFSKEDGRILGAQAVGSQGVERRIDVVSMAIQKSSTVYDLEEAELCYSPQFGSAKDPVNLAGMVAANVLRGDSAIIQCEDVQAGEAFILDVREPKEYEKGHIEGAVNIPLNELRDRLNELPRDKEIWTCCFVGQRSYFANRMLTQNGFKVRNISGGYRMMTLNKACGQAGGCVIM